MFKWVKESLFGNSDSLGNGSLSPVRTPPMPKVKPTKGSNISEPVISFVETVRKYPKRFDVGQDTHWYTVRTEREIADYKAYKIWDKKLDKGWYVRGDRWLPNMHFVSLYNSKGYHPVYYEHAFFLTPDEKEYLIQEISSIMNYRVDRKAKLDKIRADRRIRDTRNKLKELYK